MVCSASRCILTNLLVFTCQNFVITILVQLIFSFPIVVQNPPPLNVSWQTDKTQIITMKKIQNHRETLNPIITSKSPSWSAIDCSSWQWACAKMWHCRCKSMPIKPSKSQNQYPWKMKRYIECFKMEYASLDHCPLHSS
jgi:hypothetical protein